MGEFVNPPWLKILAGLTTLLIILLNAVLLFYTFRNASK